MGEATSYLVEMHATRHRPRGDPILCPGAGNAGSIECSTVRVCISPSGHRPILQPADGNITPTWGAILDDRMMLSTIEDYILRERKRRNITTVDDRIKPELSGESFDEFVMLLERQLMTTDIGCGGWEDL